MKFFGPSKNEIWKQLCDQTGALFVDGGFWKGKWVELNYEDKVIILDTFTRSTGNSSVTYTRMRCETSNPLEFKFKIYQKHIFSGIAKVFGLKDIEIGDEEFDKQYIIQSNDELKLMTFFSDYKLKDLISGQPNIYLTFEEGIINFQVIGVIKDTERLKNLFDLFKHLIDKLDRLS